MHGADDAALRRAIFEHAQDAMILLDDAGVVTDANCAACDLFARAHGDLVGRVAATLAPEADHAVGRHALDEAMRGQGATRGEVRLERPDGTRRIVECVLTAAVVPGAHLVVLRDVTDRRAREAEAERYRVLWQRARDVVLFVDANGRVLDANDAAIELYGWTRAELLGMPIGDLRAPETRAEIESQLGEAFTQGVLFETVHVRKDGGRVPVEVGSRSTTIGARKVLLSVIRDISERSSMQARLLEADRLATVGTLAAGVAHEINNPLTYVMASLELALRALRGPVDDSVLARARELVATALEGSERMRAIVSDLKTLGRTDDERAAVDVRKVLDSCIEVAQHELGAVAIVRSYRDVPRVNANEGRIAQVFLNLIVNAAHALRAGERKGGTIRIDTDVDARGRVVVRVADDGVGIAPSILPRIFDAFVTTKPAGQGTGLGLYVSRSIVSALGGTLEAESTVDSGSVFTVTLPVGEGAARSDRPDAVRALRAARILLIDDEAAIGRTLRDALDEHELVVLESAEAAVAWLREDVRFDIVLTDLSMPGMSGIALIEHLRADYPELASRVIVMTGGALSRSSDASLARVSCLEKPFTVEVLRDAIARKLGA